MAGRDVDLLAGVSRETQERLEALLALTRKWNPAINLVSRASLGDGWTRHVLDSAQLERLAPATAQTWADLGSGGGYPGLVVAVLSRETCPARHVTLVESDQRKATFLREAARQLDLPVQVRAERIEDCAPLAAAVVSARALAPLAALCGFAFRHMAPDGVALFLKGREHAAELDEARKTWRFQEETHPSLTDPQAAVLALREISRA